MINKKSGNERCQVSTFVHPLAAAARIARSVSAALATGVDDEK